MYDLYNILIHNHIVILENQYFLASYIVLYVTVYQYITSLSARVSTVGSQWNTLWCKHYIRVCYTQIGKNTTATCTSCSCGILPPKVVKELEFVQVSLQSRIMKQFHSRDCCSPWKSSHVIGTHVKSHPILRNQETGEPRLGSPVFSHGKLYRPAQVDPSLNYELCFQACWASCWPMYHAIPNFVSHLYTLLAPSQNIWYSFKAGLLPSGCKLTFAHPTCQPTFSSDEVSWDQATTLKPISVQFTTKRWKPGSLKATTRCFGAKP